MSRVSSQQSVAVAPTPDASPKKVGQAGLPASFRGFGEAGAVKSPSSPEFGGILPQLQVEYRQTFAYQPSMVCSVLSWQVFPATHTFPPRLRISGANIDKL